MPGSELPAVGRDQNDGDIPFITALPSGNGGGVRGGRALPDPLGDEVAAERPHSNEQAIVERALDRDAALGRLVRVEALADRQLARGLGMLWRDQLYRPLGFVRATDFVRERLGIRESRARWLSRLGQRLLLFPEFDEAFLQGRINASQVLELTRIVHSATPETERLAWIERARGKTIRALRKEVLLAKRRLTETDAADDSSTDANASVSPAGPSASAGDDLIFAPGANFEAPPQGGWMSIPAPARVASLWHAAVDLARASSGRHLSQGSSAELIFAEYLSAFGAGEEEDVKPPPTHRDRELQALFDALNRRHPLRLAPLTPESDEPAHEDLRPQLVGRRRSSTIPDVELPAGCLADQARDAWQLAAALERLCEFKKRLRYDIAGLLRSTYEEAGWHRVGFASFNEYCEQCLGFGLRRAERLIRFRRGLERFRRLRRAHLEGGMSYTAALLLLAILHPSTEEAWVTWARGITYRELERVVEFARTYALPEAHPDVFDSWIQGLVNLGLAQRGNGRQRGVSGQENARPQEGLRPSPQVEPAKVRPTEEVFPSRAKATAFDAVPFGCALPPSAPGSLPVIQGLPSDLALAEPERCVARIRFWLPADALDLAYRTLHRSRLLMPNPLLETWTYLEVILVHFIQSLDTPQARAFHRRHQVLARDQFRCSVPGCTSRAILHEHHLEHRSQGGSNQHWNKTTLCAGHHLAGVHVGVLMIGGWAPHALITLLGIHPQTGRPLACYRNERRVSVEAAEAELAAWRRWCRERGKIGATARGRATSHHPAQAVPVGDPVAHPHAVGP